MRTIKFTIPDNYSGTKLKSYLKNELKFSTRMINILKNDPIGLLLNDEHVRTIDIIKEGDILTVNMPDEKSSIPPSDCSDLDIVYEDEDIIIINKPPHLAMHPTHNHQGDTLANKIAAYYNERGIVFRAVGRLDKCTSGLVICALNKHAASFLSGNVEKSYIAIAGGCFKGKGTIDKPIYRPDPGKTLRAVGESGEHAVTHFESIVTDGKRSVLKVRLETGRTHQIRVHFSYLGAPLAGDDMYGSSDTTIDRAALHCATLDFIHPVTGENMHFEVDIPEDMDRLRKEIIKNAI